MQSSSNSMPTTTPEQHPEDVNGACITRHIPVLLQEVLNVLDIQTTDTVLDGTLGGGGHAVSMAKAMGAKGKLIGFDVDSTALERVGARLGSIAPELTLVKANFRDVQAQLVALGIKSVDKALFDLGWSSDQLEVSGRGFSFQNDEPLTMTFSDTHDDDTLTAYEIVNSWEEEHIADILYGWGGERLSRRIAHAIVIARKERPIATTAELVVIITKVVPRRGRTNPATKTFQALRIAVNDELGALKDVLEALPHITHQGSRVAFITFHSLEDKLVKNTFREWAKDGNGTIITKKPIVPTREEVEKNHRSRSAKLRVFIFA